MSTSKMLATRQRTRKDRQGTVTVEFAIMAPIIFLAFLGSIELGQLNYVRNMANDAAYQVARKAIVPGADVTAAETEALNLLSVAAGITVASIDTTETVDTIEVTVTIPVSANSWGLGRYTTDLTLEQSCRLSKQVKSEVN